jgi:DNA-binding MarR family transcriptional regulator
MVKPVDEGKSIFSIDHIGLDLWRAAAAWRSRLHREMVARGHSWYGDARAAIAASLDPRGLPQSELVARMGVSKQAVQQLLDGLEADGIVRRVPDEGDRRGKRVEYTAAGLLAVRDANAIKQRMERELVARIGARAVRDLRSVLQELAQAFEET